MATAALAVPAGRGPVPEIRSELELIGTAIALGATDNGQVTESERARERDFWQAAERGEVEASDPVVIGDLADAIMCGEDPLGDALQRLRSRPTRRARGATYTPQPLVVAMVRWLETTGDVARVIDPGAGSGRFAIEAAKRFPKAAVIAIENDPTAALLCRANARVLGVDDRVSVVVDDFRRLTLERIPGETAFVGNPPYVRHHGLLRADKQWLVDQARTLDLQASRRAGLHVHFLLHIAQIARAGDRGALVTACQWLDVEYGALARTLFLDHLGGRSLQVFDPRQTPFDDEATAAIACFRVGTKPRVVRMRRIRKTGSLVDLEAGRTVSYERLARASRWTPLLQANRSRQTITGSIALGSIFRVHRGVATGYNGFFVVTDCDLPKRFLRPVISRAKELRAAGPRLEDAEPLRRLVTLPRELDDLSPAELEPVMAFIERGRELQVDQRRLARDRRGPWWALEVGRPAPILVTYMSKRAPYFVRNCISAAHLNIAHGLFPTEPMSLDCLDQWVDHLNRLGSVQGGRTYAGGLVKFEPSELGRLWVSPPTA